MGARSGARHLQAVGEESGDPTCDEVIFTVGKGLKRLEMRHGLTNKI